MTSNNRVVWSEGLFLRPQHFQQQSRSMERLIEDRCESLRPFSWGFKTLELDTQLLSVGKISIASASGVLPDGTPFNIPEEDDPPPPLDVPDNLRDTVIHLALPVRRPGMLEVDASGEEEGLARMRPEEFDIRDATANSPTSALVQVGRLRLKMLPASEAHAEYTTLGLAHLVEVRTDKQVVLEKSYIPPVLDCAAAGPLAGFANELRGLLHHRGAALAGRVSEAGRGGAAEIADFLLLQVVNRFEPLVAHFAQLSGLHPESLYQVLVAAAGEMSTFTTPGKRPAEWPAYRHEDLRATFAPVQDALRESLGMVLEQKATALPIKERAYGIRIAKLADRSLLQQASFVLAVAADMPADSLRKRFPAQLKIGPSGKIRDLVNLQLPGIQLQSLPVAPRQIPYHAGFVYFEVNRSGEYWDMLKETGDFAFHIGGEFPGLQMEFWAIRE